MVQRTPSILNTIKTSIQSIAAGSNLIGRVDARDGDKIWSYNGVASENSDNNSLPAGASSVQSTEVPAGEVHIITTVSFQITSASVTRAVLVSISDGVWITLADLSPVSGTWYVYTPKVYSVAGDKISLNVYDATAEDVAKLRHTGYRMKV